MTFTETLGFNDIYPIGDLKGCTMKEAIEHNPMKVKEDHCVHFVLKGDVIKYLINTLSKRKQL